MKAETKISERRACILVGIDRLTFQYQPQIRNDAALRERKKMIEVWRVKCNEVRPHSSLKNARLRVFATRIKEQKPTANPLLQLV